MKNAAPVFLRALAVWLIIIGAETLHGILRTLLLEPYLGDFRARQTAVFSGAVMILIITFLFIRWIRAENQRQLFLIGFFWVVMTFAFEISLGKLVLNLSWERIFSDYNVLQGGLLPIGFLVMLFAPLTAAYFRKNSPR